MAKQVTVQSGQTLTDICVQELGDATRLNEVAIMNSLLASVELVPGQIIKVPEVSAEKLELLKLFKINKPASYSGVEQAPLEGVGYWVIGIDNVVQ